MKKLEQLRVQIDETDDQIIELLNRRADLVLQVKDAKKEGNIDIYTPERERQILNRVASLIGGGAFPVTSAEKVFRTIISATRSLIGELVVSYLGPEYSLAQDAALKQFGDTVVYRPDANSAEVVKKVESGDAHFGVLPLESAAAGLVTTTFEVLVQSKLQIVAEIALRERLVVVGNAENLAAVDKVYSDAEYFLHSAEWVNANLSAAEKIVEDNTARAAQRATEAERVAAIISQMAAERLSLPLLATGVENNTGIESRYIVVGHRMPASTIRDKTSLLVSVEERSGALRSVLEPFSSRGITLTKIESKTLRRRAGEYVFFIDILGHQSEPALSEAIEELREISGALKVLGSYPLAASGPE